ncbi:hypothetical protein [Inhella gelatinilytica]|uniref:Uncharacterized protein n=1 Tax=Inhella gelatinilytica TaxID=2795030 RepID=A0A931NCE5_9BURK|nr:hypothetical protein [Inhella gelatinilytica]MBH9551479.1 hypothetical protein [Inhella gelatinilytica]
MSTLRAVDFLTMTVMAAGVSVASAVALTVFNPAAATAAAPVVVLPRIEITVPAPAGAQLLAEPPAAGALRPSKPRPQ